MTIPATCSMILTGEIITIQAETQVNLTVNANTTLMGCDLSNGTVTVAGDNVHLATMTDTDVITVNGDNCSISGLRCDGIILGANVTDF